MYAKLIREENAGNKMANYLRLLFISFLLVISKIHKIGASFDTAQITETALTFIIQYNSLLHKSAKLLLLT